MVHTMSFLALAMLFCLALGQVAISNQYIMVDGQRFFVRGADYSIIPIGKTPDTSYWDDTAANTTFGRAVWQRDIANIKRMNGNTIRVYSMGGGNHTAFYDALLANGIRIILNMWVNWGDFSDPTFKANALRDWKNFIIKERHPAVLMWCFGNELNQGGGRDGPLFSLLNEARRVVQENDLPNPRPTTTTFADRDLSSTVATFYQSSQIDVWSFQIYRGPSFYDLFTSFNNTVKLRKPLVITEFGCDAYDNPNQRVDEAQHESFNMRLWNELYSNAGVVAGGLAFNYADEWWRCDKNNAGVQKTCGNVAQNTCFDNYWNQEYSGLYSISKNPVQNGPDVLTPRSIVTSLTQLWRIDPYKITTVAPTTTKAPTTPAPTTTKAPTTTVTPTTTVPPTITGVPGCWTCGPGWYQDPKEWDRCSCSKITSRKVEVQSLYYRKSSVLIN
ncbi:beta-glucanosyltransferase PGA4 [Acrasis kona]|uniref:Beta-glucanosyltransferase PGA4 n=1 Tax=Acrasis kona TaxID=1008807 RepID=A0AAW2ZEE4_9EUKA